MLPSEPLTALRGIGPHRAERLLGLGLECVGDLLLLIPRRIERAPEPATIAVARRDADRQADLQGREFRLSGTLSSLRFHRSGRGRSLLKVRLEDGTGFVDLLMFNQPWRRDEFRVLVEEGEKVELAGRIVSTRSGPALASPRRHTDERPLPEPGTYVPVYPLTEGIGQDLLRGLIQIVLDDAPGDGGITLPAERLPAPLLAEMDLPPLPTAVVELHRPADASAFARATRRVAFERALAFQARLRARRAEASNRQALRFPRTASDEAERVGCLPFRLTAGQERVLGEILEDLARGVPMRRLFQGDVGVGKTVVALVACARVVKDGGQAALMAPTELLAEQHYRGLVAVEPGLGESLGLRPVLLHGSLSSAARRDALARLAKGSANLAIGTHALFSEEVAFRQLGLAVVDEQQRFGVAQRRRLLAKGPGAHQLLMTATPIPRTLALTLYGDLDVSVLEESPPGRGQAQTHIVDTKQRTRVLNEVARRVARGERVFWVCPRIHREDPDPSVAEEGPAAAEATFEWLLAELPSPPGPGVELVHSEIPVEERQARLARFRSGATAILVGTTVLEVGVDVPDATVMVVEGAEHLGLSQLHQLRGRVGRGPAASICILMADGKGLERLRFLEKTTSGFDVAEEDLRQRGMGALAGIHQSGLNLEGFGSGIGLDDDGIDLLLAARRVIASSPELAASYSPAAEQPAG